MFEKRSLAVLIGTCFLVGFGATCTVDSGSSQGAAPLHIDIPVKLDKANVVFDVGHLVLTGDMPFVLGDLNLLAGDYGDRGTQGEIIAIFHGDAAYLILNDDAYNANRHVQTGNSYAKLIAGLMKRGVQIELCGATAAANHWGNADLLPGVKVNTDAMVRVIQLQQKGYMMIYE
jgi:intracellular sulfur oxidation DsrE/DsrF family protein